jgi:hypothetical protein
MSWFALEDEDSCGGASISGASNGDATFFCQTRFGFEFDFGLIAPPHLLEVCSAHNNKIEIKCMGSIGGKTPTELKLYIFFLF